MTKKKKQIYKPTATLKDYREAIQILMVDYADVWEKTRTFKEVDKKLKKLGIWKLTIYMERRLSTPTRTGGAVLAVEQILTKKQLMLNVFM